jgi:flagellar protein FliS
MALPTPSSTPRSIAGAANRYHRDGTQVASPNRVVVLLYERLLKDLDTAVDLLDHGRSAHEPLVHAQDIVDGLDVSLDTSQWDAGNTLRSIYNYLHNELVTANLEHDPTRVRHCRTLIAPLADAWNNAATSEPVQTIETDQ